MKRIIVILTVLLMLGLVLLPNSLEADEVKVPFGSVKPSCYGQIDMSKSDFALSEIGKECVVESWLEDNLSKDGEKSRKEKQESQPADYSNTDWHSELKKVDTYRYEGKTSGIQIVLKKEEGMFPGDWKEDPINAEASNLDEARIGRSLEVVEKALDKYPSELLRGNLKRIYVLKSLYFYGVEYGATNSNESVYIINRGKKRGYTNSFLEELFHEEFSSILLRNYDYCFKERSWRDVNPDSFSYGEGGRKAIQSGEASLKVNTSWLRKGFLYQYATSDLEEDFNSFARKTFTGKEIWQYAKDYPKIEKKLRLMIDFYHEIDPVFTEEYFRSLK